MDRDGLIHILIGTIEPLGTLRSNKKNWNPRNHFPYGSILEFRGGGGLYSRCYLTKIICHLGWWSFLFQKEKFSVNKLYFCKFG
jgi:hypothetical protein